MTTVKSKPAPIITVDNVKRLYQVGSNNINAVRGINLKIYPSDFVIVYGPSGCGKSTLLNIISGIDTPTKGKVLIRDTNLFLMEEDERSEFRSKKMGIVHQMPYWVKSLNVMENVALPLIIGGKHPKLAYDRALEAMKDAKVEQFAKQLPTQLSGGQQQRVGIARALISNPWIILADEPTGNLDSTSSDEIMALFDILNKKYKRTIVLVTHNQSYWTVGTREIEMKDGLIVKQKSNET